MQFPILGDPGWLIFAISRHAAEPILWFKGSRVTLATGVQNVDVLAEANVKVRACRDHRLITDGFDRFREYEFAFTDLLHTLFEGVRHQLPFLSFAAAVEAFPKVHKLRVDLAAAVICVLHIIILVASETFSIAFIPHG